MHRAIVSTLVLGLCAVAGAGEGDPSPGSVQKAKDAGAAWLETTFAKGFEDETDHDMAELVTLTLAHLGKNLQDKTYAQGVAALEKIKPRFTYRCAVQAMALQEINPRLYQAKIAHCAQWLVDTQLAGGEWGYPGALGTMPKGFEVSAPPPPEGTKEGDTAPKASWKIQRRESITSEKVLKGDSSNTQFAILGLRAARLAGIEVPKETWKAALAYVRKYQHEDGGWGYVISGENDESSYASLTCANVCSLAICLDALGTKDVKSDPGIQKAQKWLDKWFDVSTNAGMDRSMWTQASPWQYYHLYSLERAGRVLGVETLGKRKWYAEGSKWLLAHQQGDGRWEDTEGRGGSRPPYFTPADTCFALLFLARATRPITK